MKTFQAIFLLCLYGLSSGAPQYSAPSPTIISEPPVYAFNFNVDNAESAELQKFGQEEDRDGDSTHGEYRVALPDGRTQIVTYQVTGDSGFVADVRYEGEILPYSPPKPVAYKPAPVVYKPAPVVLKPIPVAPPKPAPVVLQPIPPPAPIVYRPRPSLPPKPIQSKKEYGPVRFNPFG